MGWRKKQKPSTLSGKHEKIIHYKEEFSDWMRKQDAKVSYLEKTFFKKKGRQRLKIKG